MIQKSIEIAGYTVNLIFDDFSQNSHQLLIQVLKGKMLVAFKTLYFKK